MPPDQQVQGSRPFPTHWLVNRDAALHEWISVELTCFAGEGPHKPPSDTYAVRKGGLCLDDNMEWVFEPIPSSRDKEFYARHRWSLEDALEHATYVAMRENARA